MTKTFDKIVDPTRTEKISHILFEARHLLYNLDANKLKLYFVQMGIKKLKQSQKYSIKAQESNDEEKLEISKIQKFIKKESKELDFKKEIKTSDIGDWNQMTVNRDTDGIALMNGNQPMTAVGLGILAQD